MRSLLAGCRLIQPAEKIPYTIATSAQASASHKPYCSSVNFLPGNEALKQQRNYRTGYRDSMLQCGGGGMADEFERDPGLVSLPIRGRAGVGVGFLSAGSLLNLSADGKSPRLNSSHECASRMPSSAGKKKE